MKLLIVDDSSTTRKVIKAAVSALDMDAVEAQDGLEALEKLAQCYEELDLILLDWNMPGKSGYDVLVEVKGNEKYRDIPVMMVTTEGQNINIVAAVRAGAANYLTKPFTVADLQTKILECLGKEGEQA